MMEAVFWLSVVGVFYPYFGYPAVLWLVGRFRRREARPVGTCAYPSVSMIVPVHNEEAHIAGKIANTASLRYPQDRLQIVFVSDGSTDRTAELIRHNATASMCLVELPARQGKAAALNTGVALATSDILVFSDASIDLAPDALQQIVQPFADPGIGCVSGEDRIDETGGEGFYGRYEMFLRRLESRTGSIVGASGSFYAQRRSLCGPFVGGMAPDFLSVLRTVGQGFRAVSEPAAVGTMASVQDPRHEFERKVRTVIRGLTTLLAHGSLLNPFRFGLFSFELFSHKLGRWSVPFFLVLALLSPLALLRSPWYAAALLGQLGFYLTASAAFAQLGGIHRSFVGKASLFFTTVNMAILLAWLHYAAGVRRELWTPSRR